MPGMIDLKHVGVFTRDDPDDGEYRLDVIRRLFHRAHIELTMLPTEGPIAPLDLVIALGGDGTVLRALSAWPGVPVLAVNFGHLGFLTASDRDELDTVLVRLLSDDYFLEERLTLEVQHRGASYRCVNEVVIKGTTHMIQATIRVNGQEVSRPRGDGVIVGTPTGSTAYLLSTGAPLIMPTMDCINVKPLNEYSFSSRSIILPGSARIDVEIAPELRGGDILLVADGGHVVKVTPGDAVHVERSPVPARLVFFEPDYFFRNLKSRLRW